jgi:ubiquinone/menaquinone biosynthesis C-methylase UbiE
MSLKNDFGSLVKKYDSARKGYPQEVYVYLKSLLSGSENKILDLGCGTGIATRELKENGFEVIGADKDQDMLDTAMSYPRDIEYVLCSADNLRFKDEFFNAVTMFTAFHWFNNVQSLEEISRVLKPEGIFFAALKTNRKNEETKNLDRGYFEVLKKYTSGEFDSTKPHHDTFLLKEKFSEVTIKEFPVDEYHSVDDALSLLQSLSLWHSVPEQDKPKMLEEMRVVYEGNLTNGKVHRSRTINIISGKKLY